MACNSNILVRVSEKYVLFPHSEVKAMTDVGGAVNENLIVYVPTNEDIEYVYKSSLTNFRNVLIMKHELFNDRQIKKNSAATVVYWNPVLPIREIGLGKTMVFSVLLTNNLFVCETIVIDTSQALCPIEKLNDYRNDKYFPINAASPLYYKQDLLNNDIKKFLICFDIETEDSIKILNVRRILTILQYRDTEATYAINLPNKEVDNIYRKLYWERIRRRIKGGNREKCVLVNRSTLQYIIMAQQLLSIKDSANTTLQFIAMFQDLIPSHHLVPEIIIKMNNIEGRSKRKVRVFCNDDSYSVTTLGLVPNNMPEINTQKFDYAAMNANLNDTYTLLVRHDVQDPTVKVAHYNYYF
ncbi:ODV-EC43 [Operophtera brumata nucleopolyhedrovirus]|uniref:ODV-EC43 n=1 Tax=Operophtera brumata nucleopolyhedrovirus TaxID=1046267 RepID=A0A2H4UZX7_9ABAC|nr:ODV-EC43 [Operophtera brumata nucleopolyhedrovirus]AUA60321.1 ODV-EC43 [Operophtera brumata nucleopolyhedrovirus]